MDINLKRFEVGYIDSVSSHHDGLRDAIVEASNLVAMPGLAIIYHDALPGRTQTWGVDDGKLVAISRKGLKNA
jgi:hypothetical protein